MKLARYAAVLALFAGEPSAWAQNAKSVPVVAQPDFAGRDKQFSYLRTRIREALREDANFAGHYTIVTMGCGTGCTNNLMVDRKTGKVTNLPYGGEFQQMLTLRHRVDRASLVASWFEGQLCYVQEARWTGSGFIMSDEPRWKPDEVCNG